MPAAAAVEPRRTSTGSVDSSAAGDDEKVRVEQAAPPGGWVPRAAGEPGSVERLFRERRQEEERG
jgi:hypothetical protein